MASVARRLFDEVDQDPPDCAALGVGEPRGSWERDPTPEVIDAGDRGVGPGSSLFVLVERAGERLDLLELEAVHVLLKGRTTNGYILDAVGPAPLSIGEVLDDASQAERASRRGETSLVLGQPVGGMTDRLPLMFEEGDQA